MDIDTLINGPDPLLSPDGVPEAETPKIKFNIEIDNKQKNIIDALIATIKNIGDSPEGEDRAKNNTENYIKCIELLLGVKQNFLNGNMYMFMTSGFNSLSKIPFFDPDTQKVVEVTMKDIEFTFEDDLKEEIPKEDIKNFVDFIKLEENLAKENLSKPEIIEAKENYLKPKRKKLPTVEYIKELREKYKLEGIE
jgi:hypothetical protein